MIYVIKFKGFEPTHFYCEYIIFLVDMLITLYDKYLKLIFIQT